MRGPVRAAPEFLRHRPGRHAFSIRRGQLEHDFLCGVHGNDDNSGRRGLYRLNDDYAAADHRRPDYHQGANHHQGAYYDHNDHDHKGANHDHPAGDSGAGNNPPCHPPGIAHRRRGGKFLP